MSYHPAAPTTRLERADHLQAGMFVRFAGCEERIRGLVRDPKHVVVDLCGLRLRLDATRKVEVVDRGEEAF